MNSYFVFFKGYNSLDWNFFILRRYNWAFSSHQLLAKENSCEYCQRVYCVKITWQFCNGSWKSGKRVSWIMYYVQTKTYMWGNNMFHNKIVSRGKTHFGLAYISINWILSKSILFGNYAINRESHWQSIFMTCSFDS